MLATADADGRAHRGPIGSISPAEYGRLLAAHRRPGARHDVAGLVSADANRLRDLYQQGPGQRDGELAAGLNCRRRRLASLRRGTRPAGCAWANSAPEYVTYHDEEWGTPLRGDDALFERLCLEAFQSGLSWITILRKRPAFRAAFAGFAIDAVAEFGPDDEARLMADAGIVRNRAKIAAAIRNARAAQQLPEGLSELLWSFAPDGGRPAPGHPRRRAGDQRGVGGHGQGAQAARLRVRRSDHGLRAHAGHRDGRRPRRRLLPSTAAFRACEGLMLDVGPVIRDHWSQSTASTDAAPPPAPAGVVRPAKEARMAAMKPRTGEGPLEVTKEGRGLVMRVPLEGGGRLVVELSPDEAAALSEALKGATS